MRERLGTAPFLWLPFYATALRQGITSRKRTSLRDQIHDDDCLLVATVSLPEMGA